MPRRGGFTLIELVVSLSVMTILMAGIASALMIASHALPDRDSPLAVAADAAEMVERITAELYDAQSFGTRSATSVAFTVQDRTGDGNPDTIRYAWSGTPGAPLTRKVNLDTAYTVLQNVQEFALLYDVRSVTEQPPPESNESAEFVLSSNTFALLPGTYDLSASNWMGQYFTPSLPQGTVSWRVSKVGFWARSSGATKGVTQVRFEIPNASGLSTGNVVGTPALMYETGLNSSHRWEQFSFSDVAGLDPNKGLCLVLALHTSDTELASIRYDTGGGTDRLTTSNAGSTWSKSLLTGMLYEVYGTATTVSQPPDVTRHYLTGVRIALRAGDDTGRRIESGTSILNTPEVAGP
jgi:prepilin-type N-terminal cleavage/methylation domain-containing protein